MRSRYFVLLLAALLAGCRHARTVTPDPPVQAVAGNADAAAPALVREILGVSAKDALARARLRTRIEMLLGDPAVTECVEFVRGAAPVEERVRVIDFLAGLADPTWLGFLVDLMGGAECPKPLVLAAHRALCAAAFFHVELDPELNYEARRALVARDWERWWLANLGLTQSEWLVRRLPGAPESERLEIIGHLIRVGDATAVPPLMRIVDTGTIDFRGRALMAVSYLTNTVFFEFDAVKAESGVQPEQIQILDGVLRCEEWWKTAAAKPPAEWIRDGFRARGYGLHDPPQPEDLDALARALEDAHPALRSQALRHLILWTGEVILTDMTRGREAFRPLARQWREWIAAHRGKVRWDAGLGRFVQARMAD